MRGEELLRRLRELVGFSRPSAYAAPNIVVIRNRVKNVFFIVLFVYLVRQSLAANIAPDFERNLKYDNLYNRLQKKQSAEGQKRPPKQRFREGGGDVGKAPAV